MELNEKQSAHPRPDDEDVSSTESEAPEPIDPEVSRKEAEILEACRKRDVGLLRSLSESKGGLLKDDLRQQACMCLQSSQRHSK